MKIVFVAPRYHTNQHFWIKMLQSAGHEVYFFVGSTDPSTENRSVLTPEVVPHTTLPRFVRSTIDRFAKMTGRVAQTDFHHVPSRRWLHSRLAAIRPDVVIVRHSTYPISIAAFLAANTLGIKTILYNQDPLDAPYNRSTRLLQMVGIVPRHRITPLRIDQHSTHHAPTNSWYVPLIVETGFAIQTREYCPDDIVRLLFIGKFDLPRKQHKLMLAAFAELSKKYNVSLSMAGYYYPSVAPYLQELHAYVQELSIADRVTFYTGLTHEETMDLYSKHDIFVLPSTDEPFSISPLEAMARGLAVVVTDTNGARFVIPPEGGAIAKSHNLESLVTSIETYVQKPETIATAGICNHLVIEQRFGSTAFVSNLMASIAAD